MRGAQLLLLVLAIVFFMLAGNGITGRGRFQFQWLAFACLVGWYLVGKV
ncbi:MAG TPA: hypothetical protein VJS44_08320 [Pyrinomonadaceae bacterium]|nr:hypothetical protein [Pyrinomonadaceae bacterium]